MVFFRFLNRMMFQGAEPRERYRCLQHFYRMPEPVVNRFYASALRLGDYPRLLAGRPPIPVRRALGCLRDPGHSATARWGADFFLGLTPSEVTK